MIKQFEEALKLNSKCKHFFLLYLIQVQSVFFDDVVFFSILLFKKCLQFRATTLTHMLNRGFPNSVRTQLQRCLGVMATIQSSLLHCPPYLAFRMLFTWLGRSYVSLHLFPFLLAEKTYIP